MRLWNREGGGGRSAGKAGRTVCYWTPEEDRVRLHRALWAMERHLEFTFKTKWSLIKELDHV